MLRFACPHCGRQIEAHPEDAQRSLRCPGCLQSVNVPGADQITAAAPAAPAGTGLPVWVKALFVLLLAGGGAAGVWYWNKHKDKDEQVNRPDKDPEVEGDGPEVTDLRLLPGDAQVVATVRSAELYGMPAARDALEKARKSNPKQIDPAARLERDVGLKPDEVDLLHAVVRDADRKTAWVVAKTLQPLDREKILGKVAGHKAAYHAKRRYYLGKTGEGDPIAVHFAGPKVLVVSNEAGMKLAMEQASAKPADEAQPLKATIALVETSKSQLIAGLNPAGGGMEWSMGEDFALVRTIVDPGKIKTARVTIDADDKNATLKVVVEMADEDSARVLGGGLLWFGARTMADQKLPAGEGKNEALKILGAVKPSVNKKKPTEVELISKTDTPTMAKGVVYLGQMAMEKMGK
jgi:hypothetical protein